MTSSTEDLQVFKVDRRGRVHLPAERRRALLEEFERGGASAPEFCRLVGINYGTFAGWRAKRRREQAAAAPVVATPAAVPAAAPGPRLEAATPRRTVQLFEAMVEAPAPAAGGSALALELPGRARLLITARAHLPWAAELLHWLAAPEGRAC